MRKISKALLAVPIIFSLIAPSLTVFAWGDSSGGRPSYSLQEVYEQEAEFGNTPFFNSVDIAETDYEWYKETFDESLTVGEVTNEKNYVIVRETESADAQWAANEIIVEDGKTYTIRAYVVNDNPHGEDATAEGTRIWFSIPRTSNTETSVNGFISSTNAFPEEYVDYVTFRSEETFHLEYVTGSATIQNSGATNGTVLGDEIIKTAGSEVDGVLIGYNNLDGQLPGGRQYACSVDIQIKVVFDHGFLVEQKARVVGRGKEWIEDSIDAKVGDIIEFQTQYRNLSEESQYGVAIRGILPEGLQYVEGSTILYNSNFPDGEPVESDGITTSGISIGNYSAGANAYVRFRAEVISIPEAGELVNIIQVQAGEEQLIMNDSITIRQSVDDNRAILEIALIAVGVTALIVVIIVVSALRYSKRRHSGNS